MNYNNKKDCSYSTWITKVYHCIKSFFGFIAMKWFNNDENDSLELSVLKDDHHFDNNGATWSRGFKERALEWESSPYNQNSFHSTSTNLTGNEPFELSVLQENEEGATWSFHYEERSIEWENSPYKGYPLVDMEWVPIFNNDETCAMDWDPISMENDPMEWEPTSNEETCEMEWEPTISGCYLSSFATNLVRANNQYVSLLPSLFKNSISLNITSLKPSHFGKR